MKVLFIKDVGGVGQRNTVKEISDGYALNYLIPNGLAVQATSEKIREVEARTKEERALHAKHDAELKGRIRSLEGERIEMKVRATEKGGLFKAITAADIQKVLSVNFPDGTIQLDRPIKEVGEYAIVIGLAEARATLTLVVKAV